MSEKLQINNSLLLILTIIFLFLTGHLCAQNPLVPLIGAQVFIEPGQTGDEIDNWFRVLEEAGMKICRIRMFEKHMHLEDDTWDFSLYDQAFRSAEKHQVKIFATLFPVDSKNSVGGEKFPESQHHLDNISEYIKNVVSHFRQYGALYGWVLQNEPGTGGSVTDNEFTRTFLNQWKNGQSLSEYNSKGYLIEPFESKSFLRDYETWFLNWIATEIKKYDPGRFLHVNNHQIFENVAEYDFPAWRKFLTSLGASAHPSWHFGYFTRPQYAMALSANCEIVRSGAGDIPFWITELQGGNNTYSGFTPICPTRDEITQWLWTSLISGAKGIIFWCLNPRASADEAGEWSMLTFQNEPSDRLKAAAEVINTLNKESPLFEQLKPAKNNIHILYSRESLWAESRSQIKGEKAEGRNTGGVMKSALGYYEILCENGIGCDFGEMNEFAWGDDCYTGETIILAHQIAIPSVYNQKIKDFVNRGGKLIVSGLTGFFDENMHNVMKTGFPFEDLFGGNLKEIKHAGNLFELQLEQPPLTMPAHLWRGTIKPTSAETIGLFEGEPVATRNYYGKGEVVWIPSLVGLGARLGDSSGLSGFLRAEIMKASAENPVCFKKQEKGILMKTGFSANSPVSVVINKSMKIRNIPLIVSSGQTGTLLFSTRSGLVSKKNIITIHPEETLVIAWGKKQ